MIAHIQQNIPEVRNRNRIKTQPDIIWNQEIIFTIPAMDFTALPGDRQLSSAVIAKHPNPFFTTGKFPLCFGRLLGNQVLCERDYTFKKCGDLPYRMNLAAFFAGKTLRAAFRYLNDLLNRPDIAASVLASREHLPKLKGIVAQAGHYAIGPAVLLFLHGKGIHQPVCDEPIPYNKRSKGLLAAFITENPFRGFVNRQGPHAVTAIY
jgi:hypothetical protein